MERRLTGFQSLLLLEEIVGMIMSLSPLFILFFFRFSSPRSADDIIYGGRGMDTLKAKKGKGLDRANIYFREMLHSLSLALRPIGRNDVSETWFLIALPLACLAVDSSWNMRPKRPFLFIQSMIYALPHAAATAAADDDDENCNIVRAISPPCVLQEAVASTAARSAIRFTAAVKTAKSTFLERRDWTPSSSATTTSCTTATLTSCTRCRSWTGSR